MALFLLPTVGLALSTPPISAPEASLRSLFAPAAPDDVLACPLPGKSPLFTVQTAIGGQIRRTKRTAEGLTYPTNALYTDLVPSAGRDVPLSFEELVEEMQDAWGSRVQTGLFRSPLTAFLYERGWRDNFKRAGFPGIDAEFAEVSEFFRPVAASASLDRPGV